MATGIVPDRAAAMRVERLIKARYEPWHREGMINVEFPQGGWTETWSEDAPPLDLREAIEQVLGANG